MELTYSAPVRLRAGVCRRNPEPVVAVLFGTLLALLLAPVAHADTRPPAEGQAEGQAAISLEDALALARRHNAGLPVAAFETQIAEQQQREAEAQRRLRLGIEGNLWLAPAGTYDPAVTNLGEAKFLLVLERPLYDGGGLAAEVKRAQANVAVGAARYRQAVAEVELAVRQSFAAALAAGQESTARAEGLERLRHYASLLEGRRLAGQAVAADLLRTKVRLMTDQSALVDALARLDDVKASLNTLMGRQPQADLAVAVPASPLASGSSVVAGPGDAPDLAAVRGEAERAAAELAVAQAEGRPHLDVRADAGLWGSDPLRPVPGDLAASHPGATYSDRLRRDLGASLSLSLSWSLFSSGAREARVAQADLELSRARQAISAQAAGVALARVQADQAMARAAEQMQLLIAAAPQAHDASLEAESRYLGGAATSLEVLDAYSAAVDVAVGLAQAELAYRLADAQLLRWGGSP